MKNRRALGAIPTSDRDFVDWAMGRWNEERPDLDVSSIAVVGRLTRVAALLGRRLERACQEEGIAISELSVLTALRRAGKPYRLTPTELAREVMVTSGAMSKRINRLHQAGYVERAQDPGDGRGVLVGLTEAGLGFVDKVAGRYLAAEREAINTLAPEQQAQLADLLRPLLIRYEGPAGSGRRPTIS